MVYTSRFEHNEDWPYPLPPIRRQDHLLVSGNPKHEIHWKEYGNPEGEPIIFLHGGPGGQSYENDPRFFNPDRYRIIIFDQRGAGESRPHAADDSKAALADNTTAHLIEDINKLRGALGIEGKMHILGGSWGSTLALAYAIEHPENVRSLTLRGVFLARKEDIDDFYQGNAATYHINKHKPFGVHQFFPDEWKEYVEAIPLEDRSDMIKGYAKIFASEPKSQAEQVRKDRALRAWAMWENVTSYLSRDLDPVVQGSGSREDIAQALIENHYFMNGCFLGGKSGEANRNQNWILNNVDKLKDIAIRVVDGRYDLVCPRRQADELLEALERAGAKDVQKHFSRGAGHSRFEKENIAAVTQFVDRLPPIVGKHQEAAMQDMRPGHRPGSWPSR